MANHRSASGDSSSHSGSVGLGRSSSSVSKTPYRAGSSSYAAAEPAPPPYTGGGVPAAAKRAPPPPPAPKPRPGAAAITYVTALYDYAATVSSTVSPSRGQSLIEPLSRPMGISHSPRGTRSSWSRRRRARKTGGRASSMAVKVSSLVRFIPSLSRRRAELMRWW